MCAHLTDRDQFVFFPPTFGQMIRDDFAAGKTAVSVGSHMPSVEALDMEGMITTYASLFNSSGLNF